MHAGASLEAEASSSTTFSVNSSNRSGRSRNGLLHAPSMSSFFWFLWNLATGPQSARLGLLLLRVIAGLGVESSRSESCDTDVEDGTRRRVERSV